MGGDAEEVGEFRHVTVRFVAQPLTFNDADGFFWRAVEVDGLPLSRQLAALLHGIAEWMEDRS